jgi:hypothetical protein
VNKKTTIDVKISKIESSYNTYEASYYDPHTNATFSGIFENDVLGVIAFHYFMKMIKYIFKIDKIKIVIENNKTFGMGEVSFRADISDDLE